MRRFRNTTRVGLRDIRTNRLVAVYPEIVSGSDKDIEEKVRFWYYQQSCSAENELEDYFVDALTDEEMRNDNRY